MIELLFPRLAAAMPKVRAAIKRYDRALHRAKTDEDIKLAAAKANVVLEQAARDFTEESPNSWATIESTFKPKDDFGIWSGFEGDGFFVNCSKTEKPS
jgi:hypothetical protein